MRRTRRDLFKATVLLVGGIVLSFQGLAPPGVAADRRSSKESSAEFRKELSLAVRLLKARRIDEGVEKLLSIVEKYPDDPQIKKVRKLLVEHGAAEGVRVKLADRQVFRSRLKITEKSILERQEKIRGQLERYYAKLDPLYMKHHVVLMFYDSQKRFREAGGAVTTTGHFSLARTDDEARSMEGKIEWYFPPFARTQKDRQTSIDSVLAHELTHHVNAIHFGRALPPVIDEGLATFMTSRLNTTYYQYYRETDRQRLEGDARSSLNLIARYDGFVRFLDSQRGFGKGDASVSRWYGLCYAVLDAFAEGKFQGKEVSIEKVLEALDEATGARAAKEKAKDGKRVDAPAPKSGRELVEKLAHELYDQKLEEFHRDLVQRILSKYKQR